MSETKRQSSDCRMPDETWFKLANPYRFVWHYVRHWQRHFFALMTVVVLAGAFGVAVQWQMKYLVDAMGKGPSGVDAVWHALAFFVLMTAVESILWRLSGYLGCRATLAIGVQIRLDLFNYLNGQPMRYFVENLAGSLGQRITSTAGNVGALCNTLVWRIAPPLIDFVGALILFTAVDWHLAAFMGVYFIVATGGMLVLGERGRPRHVAYAAKAGTVAGDLVDIITNMWAVKAFSAHRRESRRLYERFLDEAGAQRASWMYTEKTRAIYDLVLCIVAACMLSWTVYLWSHGTITPGDVVVVSTLTFRILHGSRDLTLSLVDTVQQFGYIEDSLRVIGQPQTVTDLPHAPPVHAERGAIEFRDVHFSYEDRREALHGVSFHILPGEKVGIVGPSGAGKSTIVNLIQRLYDVNSGAILIDGQRVSAVTQESLRAALAVIPQEISLFHRNILENIRFGSPEATDEEVFEAARAAQCDGFVRPLPDGYFSMVGERGVKLSGGQRQRVGIARAFLKKAPILILDEATSSLDSESELLVQRNIVEHLQDRTVIAVAHRLSTLVPFDRILVINEGQIVEEGTAAELRANGGLFEQMWRLQAEGQWQARTSGSGGSVRPLRTQPVTRGRTVH